MKTMNYYYYQSNLIHRPMESFKRINKIFFTTLYLIISITYYMLWGKNKIYFNRYLTMRVCVWCIPLSNGVSKRIPIYNYRAQTRDKNFRHKMQINAWKKRVAESFFYNVAKWILFAFRLSLFFNISVVNIYSYI